MKVSVIIPIYNAGRFLAETLDAVISQTHRDLEIICVLDAPTDDSEAIVKKYAARDKRIRIIKNERNFDLAISRNIGAAAATGDWIHFMDADDSINPMFYEKMIACAGNAPVATCEVFYEKKPRRGIAFPHDRIVCGNEKWNATLARSRGWAWRWLIRRDFWNAHQLSFPNLRPLEDKPAIVKMIHAAECVALCSEAVYCYLNRPGSILRAKYDSAKRQKNHDNRHAARAMIRDFLRQPFPIDLVYLWVDGSDPKWRAKKNAAIAATGADIPKNDFANGEQRSLDFDELKYSLRSVAKFAPWINHIYIVTDEQRPAWLSENPRVSIIDQSTIVPAPCFNSSVIEFGLHKIPGLSEHFLYANDDMMFGAAVRPQDFFDRRGRPIIRAKRDRRFGPYGKGWNNSGINYYEQQIINAKKLVYKKFAGNHNYNWSPGHNIDPYRKSDLANPHIKQVPTVFRERTDLQRMIFHEWPLAEKTARLRLYPRSSRLLLLLSRFSKNVPIAVDDASNIVRTPKLLCVNSSSEANRAFMQRMLPNKSEFEK